MKKIVLFLALLLPLAASAARPARSVSRSEMASIISEFRCCDGVEVVKLGWFATALTRGIAGRLGDSDADLREIRSALRGIQGVTVLEYEDAAPEIRRRLEGRLERALRGSELLMEARDDGELVQIFGVLDDSAGTVRDFVMHIPGDGTLVCLFGSMPASAISKIAAR